MKVLRHLFLDHLGVKLLSVALALTFFLFVRGDQDTVMSLSVKVLLKVPDGKLLASPPLDRVRITVRGKWSKMRDLGSREMEPLEIDLHDHPSEVFYFDEDLFRLPPGVKMVSLQPASMVVRLVDAVGKRVPVKVVLMGNPDPAVEFLGADVVPEDVMVLGESEAITSLRGIETEPIDLASRTESITVKVPLVKPAGQIQFVEDNESVSRRYVEVNLRFKDKIGRRTFERVPVKVVGTTYSSELRPDKVELKLEGALRELNRIEDEDLMPYIDGADADGRPPGTHRKGVQVDNLPPGVLVLSTRPSVFHLTTIRRQEDRSTSKKDNEDLDEVEPLAADPANVHPPP